MTVRELAAKIGLSSPSTTERIRKLEDCGALSRYTISTNYTSIGLGIIAHVRLYAHPGELARLGQMLTDAPEIVEADRVTGKDCFVAKVVVADLAQLKP